MGVNLIDHEQAEAAYNNAVSLARDLVRPEAHYLSPNAKLGSLSEAEWRKLALAIVSGWIQMRSRQLTEERFFDEQYFLATGEVPEPFELGACATVLPALGDFVEKLGVTDKPIGDWSKDQILHFVWTAFELVEEARTSRDERPGPLSRPEMVGGTLMAG